MRMSDFNSWVFDNWADEHTPQNRGISRNCGAVDYDRDYYYKDYGFDRHDEPEYEDCLSPAEHERCEKIPKDKRTKAEYALAPGADPNDFHVYRLLRCYSTEDWNTVLVWQSTHYTRNSEGQIVRAKYGHTKIRELYGDKRKYIGGVCVE